jgi:hypothetical protein
MDHHDLVFQSHGDTECYSEDGGMACNLQELDQGQGYALIDAVSGISSDWEVNDARPPGSEPMTWYVDHVVMYKVEDRPEQFVTYFGMNNPCFGPGPCTYSVPLDPSSTVNWYTYTHGEKGKLGHGWLSEFVIHSHQSIFDSSFVFKGPKGGHIGGALESLRRNRTLPIVIDCVEDEGVQTLEKFKAKLLDVVGQVSQALLVCEANRPSLVFDHRGFPFDKSIDLNCIDRVELNPGDELVMIGFNTVRPHNLTRGSKAWSNFSAFADFAFIAFQHSIFRGRFIQSKEGTSDVVAPAFWHYAEELASPTDPQGFVHAITGTCPPSISLSLTDKNAQEPTPPPVA